MQSKGRLLIVDDEVTFLKILNLMFSKYYEVRTAESGEEALNILKDGFKAEVILSDQRMPGMSGAEFLEQSIKIVPTATRVILTGYSTPKDIIPAINQGHAYMYLIKPADELALIQAIKIAFDNYNNNRKVRQNVSELKKAVEQLKEKNEELKVAMNENTELLNQSVQAISGIANYCERFYYSNHTKFVAVTAKLFAEDLGLSKDRVSNIVLASLLHSAILNSMPVSFILNDPIDLPSDEQRKEYLRYFRYSIDTISKVRKIKKYSDIISNIWEHQDGSGFPAMLSGNAITHETQVIAIVNFYHNNVYRMLPEDLKTFLKTGSITQTASTTKKRHEECIKSMYRHATWFDYDIFHHFQDLIKKKAIPTLIPDANDLTLTNIDTNLAEIIASINEVPVVEDKGSDIITVDTSTGERMQEKDLPVGQLEPGMTMGQTVLTKSGMLVVKNESVLDVPTIKNMKQLESVGQIPASVTVLLPV